LGVALSLNCEFEKASHYIDKALDITKVAKNPWGMSTMKGAQSYWLCNVQGRVDLGYQTSAEALQIAKQSGGTYSKAVAYLAHGTSCLYKGFFVEAKKHLLKGADFCDRINLFPYHALDQNQLGEAYFDLGEYQRSKDHYCKAIWILEKGRFSDSYINLNKISLARAKVMNKERDIDLESLFGYATENKLKIYDGWVRQNIGKILLNFDDKQMPEAEDWIMKAIKAHKSNGMKWHLGRDYELYAEFFRRKGDQKNSKENLNKAIEIFKQCGSGGWVEKCENELAAPQ
jgi:tetratricopeptide (TPR) repeat protein